MASHTTDSSEGALGQKPSAESPFIRSALKNEDITDETPAKRVKMAHELVTPASSQSSLAAEQDSTAHPPTPSPSSTTNPPSQSPYSLATPMSKDEIRHLLLKEANYDVEVTKQTPKRLEYLSWDDFFMSVALLSAMRSKDPKTPTGACIVDEEYRVVGIGYNGFPRGCSDDALPWTANGNESWLHSPNPFMCHAEVNAILNKCSDTVSGARLYVPLFPCNECAKVIVQSRISEVVYMEDRNHDNDTYRASRILLTMAGVKLRRYAPTVPQVQLDLASFVDESNGVIDEATLASQQAATKTRQEKEKAKFRELLVKEANLDPVKTPSTKRTNYLPWDDYFIAIAFLTAKRSKDPNTQVGACIVDQNKCIIGLGYNGFPRGCSDDHLPWARSSADSNTLHTKYPYVCHAEVNAILNKCSANAKGATLYVALFPCNECAKLIIQAGIQEVVYTSDIYHDTDCCRASRIMFQMAGVHLRQHIPSVKQVSIDFSV